MRRVVAGVEHGDGRAGPVEAGGPGLGSVDLRDRGVQRGPYPAVEVDARGSPASAVKAPSAFGAAVSERQKARA